MSVNKFGDSGGDRYITPVSSSIGLTMSQITNVFLRRDGGNNAVGVLDMNNHKIVGIADPAGPSDAVNKKYVDQNTVNSSGDLMTGNLIFKTGNNPSLTLGCNDLRGNKRFNLILGSTQNLLYCQLNNPITLQTSNGFHCRIGDSDIAKFSSSNIIFDRDVFMSDCHVTNLKEPVNERDAVTKKYVDRLLPSSTPGVYFQSLYGDGNGNYLVTDTPDISGISLSLTDAQFDRLPTGMYACYTGYLPASRLGMLPVNTKGYLICISYENGPHALNKRYQWTNKDNKTYYAWIREEVWNTWIDTIQNVGNPVNEHDVATKGYVDTALTSSASKIGESHLDMKGKKIRNMDEPTARSDAVTKGYFDHHIARISSTTAPVGAYMKLDGSSIMLGEINAGGYSVTNVADPTNAQDAATKNYVDKPRNSNLDMEEIELPICLTQLLGVMLPLTDMLIVL